MRNKKQQGGSGNGTLKKCNEYCEVVWDKFAGAWMVFHVQSSEALRDDVISIGYFSSRDPSLWYAYALRSPLLPAA